MKKKKQTIRCLDIKISFPRHLTSSAHAVGLFEKMIFTYMQFTSYYGAEYLFGF